MTDAAARLATALADRYRLERELGAGGMATVYLAQDLKHDRRVAIKVLRPELAAVIGAERFVSEIRTTANLQHPNLLPLFDSGEADGQLYYVMPYVEGETLRQRLEREQQLPLDEVVRLVSLIAGALDYAHAQGVIHRDLKPENVLLQADQPVVADFGIALAAARAGGTRITNTGLSLGTPYYMSPEQATGDRVIDARTDVYALGAVTYELLSGEPPHSGPNAQAIIARLLTEEPRPVRAVRPTTPPAMEAAIGRALQKRPADRFATCGAFARAMVAEGTTTIAAPAGRARRPALRALLGLGAAVGLAVAAWRLMPRDEPLPVLGRSTQVTTDPGLEIQPAISPDGRFLAYSAGTSARRRIYIRPVAGGRTIALSDDSMVIEMQARWSPDGESLLFLADRGVSIAPALGGSSRRVVAPGSAPVIAAAWSPDGRHLVFSRGDSLQVATSTGDSSRLVAVVRDAHSCAWSPDARWVACTRGNSVSTFPGRGFGNLGPSVIVLVPVSGGELIELTSPTESATGPTWSPDGRRLFFISNRDGPRDVYALSLTATGRARGAPQRLTTGLGAMSMSLSADGRRLAYAVYAARGNIWSVPIPASGASSAEDATRVTSGNQVIESIGISPDGKWLLYDSNLQGNADIYRIPIGSGTAERLTDDPADEFAPDLSPDGRLLAYHTFRTGSRDIEVKSLDGGAARLLTDTPGQESYPSFSPDGRALLFGRQDVRTLEIMHRDTTDRWGAPVVLADSAGGARWSPDGATIAFICLARPQRTLGICTMPAGGGASRRVAIGNEEGAAPERVLWSADGRRLFFKAHDTAGRALIWGVDAGGGKPAVLVRFPDLDRNSSRPDFAVDASRFYFTLDERESDLHLAELRAP
jgi:serine/threonine-protein kinase